MSHDLGIVLADRLDQLLAPPREVSAELAALLQAIYDRKYTGAVTLHCSNGVPKIATFVAPQIKLT